MHFDVYNHNFTCVTFISYKTCYSSKTVMKPMEINRVEEREDDEETSISSTDDDYDEDDEGQMMKEETDDEDEESDETDTDSETEEPPENSFIKLLKFMFQNEQLEGNLEKDMEKFYNHFEQFFMIQNLIPKLKLYKEFMKDFKKKLKVMKKNDRDDGIIKKSEDYEHEAFVETFDQFEVRFERNMEHFYETLGMVQVESDESDDSMSTEDEQDDEESNHNPV